MESSAATGNVVDAAARSAARGSRMAPLMLAAAGTAVLAVGLLSWLERPATTHTTSDVRVTTIPGSAGPGAAGDQTVTDTRREADEASAAPTEALVSLLVVGAALLLTSVFTQQLSKLSFLGATLELNAPPVAVQGQLLADVLRKAPPDVKSDPSRLSALYERAVLSWLSRTDAKARPRGVLRRRDSGWRPTPEDIQQAVNEALREID